MYSHFAIIMFLYWPMVSPKRIAKKKKKMSLPIEIPGLSPPSYLPLVYLLLGTGMYLPFPTSDFA